MKQMLLELVRDGQPIPLEARLREELVYLMAAAIVAVHEWEREAGDVPANVEFGVAAAPWSA